MYDTEEKLTKSRILSGSTLKIIACISMLIDHATLILWHEFRGYIVSLDYDSIMIYEKLYHVGRSIGRLAFPIFCFLLVEGFFHTKSMVKYIIRLFIMALVSEHAFNLLASGTHFDPENQNVFFTLVVSLVTIWLLDTARKRFADRPDIISVLTIVITGLGCLLAYKIDSDYDYKGVLAVTIIYLLHESRILTCLATALTFTWEPWAIPSVIPIFLYNGKRGLRLKYLFYAFYPLHIYLVYFLAKVISGNFSF